MKTGLLILGVVVLLIIMVGCSFVGTRNDLVRLQQDVQGQWSQIDTAMQRRNDLIPNLVNTAKGYAKQEQEVFKAIADARARLGGAQSNQEKMDASNQLSGALGRLLVVQENYPQLKSNENFMRLMDELAGSENRISLERRKYNESVQRYNTELQIFPKNLAASMFGFKAEPYFKADEGARTAPKVNF